MYSSIVSCSHGNHVRARGRGAPVEHPALRRLLGGGEAPEGASNLVPRLAHVQEHGGHPARAVRARARPWRELRCRSIGDRASTWRGVGHLRNNRRTSRRRLLQAVISLGFQRLLTAGAPEAGPVMSTNETSAIGTASTGKANCAPANQTGQSVNKRSAAPLPPCDRRRRAPNRTPSPPAPWLRAPSAGVSAAQTAVRAYVSHDGRRPGHLRLP